jgi:probable dihydroxyacetone kinase regulator
MITTKESIANALNKLLLTIPLNKISIKSICVEAHVNRQTFYYYYRDIIELLVFEMRDDLYAEIEGGRSYDNWRYGFLQTLRYMKRNNAKIQNIYHSTYWNEVDIYFNEFNTKIINHVVLECVQKQNLTILDTDKEFIINIYNMIFHGVFVEYIKSNMEEEPEAIVTKLNKIISGEVMKVVASFSNGADIKKV